MSTDVTAEKTFRTIYTQKKELDDLLNFYDSVQRSFMFLCEVAFVREVALNVFYFGRWRFVVG